MLTLTSGRSQPDCSGLARRDFLRVGALTLGGLALPQLLAARAKAAGQGQSYLRHKSVVLLFLSGGASHIETFDPKLDVPGAQGSLTGDVATAIPGVRFGGTFPGLAKRAKQLAIVRSFTHPVTDHVAAIRHVLSGGTVTAKDKETDGFSMGAAVTRLRGSNHPANGFPTYGLITADEVDNQYNNERGRVQIGSKAGSLGLGFAPFEPSGKSEIVKNLNLNINSDRLDDRRALLHSLDSLKRDVDANGSVTGLDKFEQQAFDLILGGAGKALDLREEDPRLLKRYDTSDFKIGHKKFRESTLGHQMLLARRMCEAGAGFVTVHSAGWDMHADGNNPGIVKGMNMLGRSVDQAVSAFLDDLQQRGLSDKVLLVITGDFGRTPKVNARGGRDHWANLGTLAFAGGGLCQGQVIGQSDRTAGNPATEPVTLPMLFSTILHTVFDVPQLRLRTGLPRELTKFYEQTNPIHGLFV
jgi:hypothetical protein